MTDTTRLATSSRELPLEPGGEVQVALTSCGVRVRGVDGDRVTVRARDGADIDDVIAMDAGPGRVSIRDAELGFRLGPVRMRMPGRSDLDIEIPRTARVSFRTLSGDVDAAGIGAESRWASASGDVRLAVAGGSHAVDSMSGDVSVEATGAIAIRARTVSGDLRIHAPRIEALGVATTSGDIRVEGGLAGGGAHEVSSVSGDVEVVTQSPLRAETQTIAGDVRASGAYTAEGGRGRRTIVIGDGSVRVSVRTTSGDIRLRADGAVRLPAPPGMPASLAAPEPPVAPEPPAVAPEPQAVPDAPAVDPTYVVAEAEAAPNLVRPAQGAESATDRREAARLDILRALERGDIDIDAATRTLEVLEDAGPRSFRGFC